MRRMLVLAAVVIAGCGTQPRPVAETGPSGTLYLAGREPGTLIRVDAAAGTATTHRVPQLGGGDPPYMVAFTGGRVVVFALGRTSSLAPDLSDPREPRRGVVLRPVGHAGPGVEHPAQARRVRAGRQLPRRCAR